MTFSVAMAWIMIGMLALAAESVLALLPAGADSLWRGRRTPVRRAVRVGFVLVHAGLGVWVFRILTSSYARALARYNPGGDCEGVWDGGDQSGCVPLDLRWQWAVFWAATGLVAFVIVRSSAMKAAPGHTDDQLVERWAGTPSPMHRR